MPSRQKAGRCKQIASLGAIGGVGWMVIGCQREPKQRPAPAATVAEAVTVVHNLTDPLNADRPIEFDTSPRASSTNWVTARPGFQYSHSSTQRGGVNPCEAQKVDANDFYDWAPLSKGRFIAPREGAFDAMAFATSLALVVPPVDWVPPVS